MTHSVYHSFIDLIRVYFKQKQFPSLSSNQFLFALASERTLCRTKCVSCLEFFNSSLWLRFFRISAVTEVEGVLEENSMELVENMESPRLIKTHLLFDMLPTSITQNKTKVL